MACAAPACQRPEPGLRRPAARHQSILQTPLDSLNDCHHNSQARSLLSYLVEAAYPDADRNGTAATEPVRSLRLIGLLRTLIDYGKHLIFTATQSPGTLDCLAFAAPIGPTGLKLLVARIGCAISRALHLEQKLAHEARLGARYQLEQLAPTRHAATDSAPGARPAAPAPRPQVQHSDPVIDPELAGLPTAEQIAAEIRHRPMHEVIATICRDLGIAPQHPLWQELDHALAAFGLSLPVPLEHHDPQRPHAAPATAAAQPAQAADRSPVPAPRCTGPPSLADTSIAA